MRDSFSRCRSDVFGATEAAATSVPSLCPRDVAEMCASGPLTLGVACVQAKLNPAILGLSYHLWMICFGSVDCFVCFSASRNVQHMKNGYRFSRISRIPRQILQKQYGLSFPRRPGVHRLSQHTDVELPASKASASSRDASKQRLFTSIGL